MPTPLRNADGTLADLTPFPLKTDASKTPPSRFQKRKGSIYATPSSRDGHVERNRDAVEEFHRAHSKRWSISSSASSNSNSGQQQQQQKSTLWGVGGGSGSGSNAASEANANHQEQRRKSSSVSGSGAA